MGNCAVSGTVKDVQGNGVANVKVVAELRANQVFDTTATPDVQIGTVIAETATASNGTWSLTLKANDDFSPADTVYEFKLKGENFDHRYTVTVPDEATANFADLTRGLPQGSL